MAQTHTLNVASHCKNKKIDEAVQKSGANKQCSLKALAVRGNNAQRAEVQEGGLAFPGRWLSHQCTPGRRALSLSLHPLSQTEEKTALIK